MRGLSCGGSLVFGHVTCRLRDRAGCAVRFRPLLRLPLHPKPLNSAVLQARNPHESEVEAYQPRCIIPSPLFSLRNRRPQARLRDMIRELITPTKTCLNRSSQRRPATLLLTKRFRTTYNC